MRIYNTNMMLAAVLVYGTSIQPTKKHSFKNTRPYLKAKSYYRIKTILTSIMGRMSSLLNSPRIIKIQFKSLNGIRLTSVLMMCKE